MEYRYSAEANSFPIIVSIAYDGDTGMLNIVARNISRYPIQARTDASTFGGIVYLVYDDGYCVKLVTREYWNQLMTGPGLSKNVRMRPGESMTWTLQAQDLVNFRGVKAIHQDREIAALFCWLDAALNQQNEDSGIVSVVNIRAEQLQAFEASKSQ
jgi:hypothetical protein